MGVAARCASLREVGPRVTEHVFGEEGDGRPAVVVGVEARSLRGERAAGCQGTGFVHISGCADLRTLFGPPAW